jgi:hypothetical protein
MGCGEGSWVERVGKGEWTEGNQALWLHGGEQPSRRRASWSRPSRLNANHSLTLRQSALHLPKWFSVSIRASRRVLSPNESARARRACAGIGSERFREHLKRAAAPRRSLPRRPRGHRSAGQDTGLSSRQRGFEPRCPCPVPFIQRPRIPDPHSGNAGSNPARDTIHSEIATARSTSGQRRGSSHAKKLARGCSSGPSSAMKRATFSAKPSRKLSAGIV